MLNRRYTWLPLILVGRALALPFYVNADLTTGANDGSSWADAFRPVSDPQDKGCLQRAIDAAAAAVVQTGQTQEVWARASSLAYEPITLADNVRVYGGFAGAETLASQSSPWTHVTKIDGGGTARCVTSEYNDNTAILRGFDLQNGYSEGWYIFYDAGGGIKLENSDAMIINCAIHDCFAPVGAGIVVYWGNPSLINLKVYNNGDTDFSHLCYGGGGLLVHQTSIEVHQCLFYGNKALDGGAIVFADAADGLLSSCTITGNTARNSYGGLYYAGGNPDLTMTVANTIIWGNSAKFYPDGTPPPSRYDIVVVNNSVILGTWYLGGNYFYADPEFVNPAAGDYDLTGCSPCRNAGGNSFLPPDIADLDWDGNITEPLPKDISLGNRKIGGFPAIVDIGAYEGPSQCSE